MNTRDQLAKSLIAGYMDHRAPALEVFKPKLLINNHLEGQKVLTSIIGELNACDEFFFSVAFITYGGLLTLINTLKVLEEKNIKGKIIASQYLNFTEPKALKKLLEFKNIELRMVVDQDLHSKAYIFKKDDHYNVIVGSSNMTQGALSANKEWNLKVSSMDQGSIVLDVLSEFDKTFEYGVPVTEDWIEAYSKIYDQKKPRFFEDKDSLFNVAGQSEPLYDLKLEAKIKPNTMQVEALKGIEGIRALGQDKALLISATGTGKTYLACFDVAKFQPKKLLFLAHREQLLNQAIKSFKNVLGEDIRVGKVGGGRRDLREQFTFSTIQTMSKDDILSQLEKDHFDYIVIDESHKAGASSYQKILSYFKPKFLLGMTATPERTDDYNICEDFNYNIAYEIRLEDAMRENMLCPFHYFGITDLHVEGREISETSDFNYLVSSERVEYIIKQIKFYGHDGSRVKGLIFCSRNDEAQRLSEAFNAYGYKSLALSGKDSQEARERAIDRLEQENPMGALDYIFTVDIFNEGVDIPKINQVVMLRPTKSAIIFVQQLGRGLRKNQSKEFVVVLDFIGNYKNNFMIPIALSDDRSFNKDTIRRFVAEGNRIIPGCTTINFDEISKRKIYDAIDTANFSTVSFIKDQYKNLKYRLGKIPSLMDFEHHDALDVVNIFECKSLKSYHTFLKKYEEDYCLKLTDLQESFIECISFKFASGKRPHELLAIKAILEGQEKPLEWMANKLSQDYDLKVEAKTFVNVFNVLTNEFATGSSKNTYKDCIFVKRLGDQVLVSDDFKACLEDKDFKEIICELVDYGLYRNRRHFGKNYKNTSFNLYQKYTYEDVCRLLEWEKNVVSLNIGGYKYDEKSKTFPVFINYHKDEGISESIKYEDRFLSSERLVAISKSKRTVESNDVKTIYSADALGVSIQLFVKKNKNDEGSKEFYYLGKIHPVGDPHPIVMAETGDKAVEFTYHLESPVREDIYDYITEA